MSGRWCRWGAGVWRGRGQQCGAPANPASGGRREGGRIHEAATTSKKQRYPRQHVTHTHTHQKTPPKKRDTHTHLLVEGQEGGGLGLIQGQHTRQFPALLAPPPPQVGLREGLGRVQHRRRRDGTRVIRRIAVVARAGAEQHAPICLHDPLCRHGAGAVAGSGVKRRLRPSCLVLIENDALRDARHATRVRTATRRTARGTHTHTHTSTWAHWWG